MRFRTFGVEMMRSQSFNIGMMIGGLIVTLGVALGRFLR